MTKTEMIAEINRLRREKNAVILSHYYQDKSIQDIANFVGDSLVLAQHAARTNAEIIVFAGVHFMAETAKIVNPSKKVLLPDLSAGCSLSDSCPPEEFAKFVANHPDHIVVSYINCSAAIKTMSDIICTSSNALKIIESIPKEKPIIFAPDKNLGKYLIRETGRDMLLWDGVCVVHEAFSFDKMVALKRKYPSAKIIAHPESEEQILKLAKFVGSTSALLKYVKTTPDQMYIVATEPGILHQMQQIASHKTYIPAPVEEDNTCACSECAYMKVNTLEKLLRCMQLESPEILIDSEIIAKAKIPLEKMFQCSYG